MRPSGPGQLQVAPCVVNSHPESWPRHVAVIMDGNGRWARRRGLPRIQGHRAGVKSARAAMEVCRDQGIAYLTLYTFSLENWQRPQAEVDELMRLLHRYLSREAKRLAENRIRFRALGRLDLLPPKVRAKVAEITAATAGNERLNLCLALSYGGRAEIVDAINAHAAGAPRAGRADADHRGRSCGAPVRARCPAARPDDPDQRREAPVEFPALGVGAHPAGFR